MATEVPQSKFVRPGRWRTLVSGWNVNFHCRFEDPAGARVKVRYGDGWPIGWDSQKKTLDGTPKSVRVSTLQSLVGARVQIKVEHDTEVQYVYVPA